MKRITFWVLTASLTFIIGAAATSLIYLKFFYVLRPLPEISLPKVEADSADSAPLTFCELANNPEKYDGKIVRVSAKLFIGTENSWFSDARCGADSAAIVTLRNEEAWKTINQARKRKNSDLLDFELNLTVAGKFVNVPYKYCCTSAPFQFEILKVENAEKINR